MTEEASRADITLSETFARFLKNWTVIVALRQVAQIAVPYATRALHETSAEFVQELTSNPALKKLIVNLDGTPARLSEIEIAMVNDGLTDMTISKALVGVDSATLVFAQSILDDCVWSLCRVCALACPEAWDEIVEKKSVEFGKLSSGSTKETIRAELIEEKLQRMEKDSLIDKMRLLFKLCKPKNFSPMKGYIYDEELLKRIDDDRHAIIHRDALSRPLHMIEQDLEYVRRTSKFLMLLVQHRYGVKFDNTRLLVGNSSLQTNALI